MKRYILLVLILALGATTALPCTDSPSTKDSVAAIADRMPDADKDGKYTGPDPAEAKKAYDQVLAGGKEAVVALVDLIAERGQGADYKARYVLHGLVTYVGRAADADKDRRMVCDALLSTLGGKAPKAVQGLVLQEIQCVARKDAAAAIGKFATDEELYDPAVRALQAIGGTEDVLRQALPAAKGRSRVAIIQALGQLRDAKAVADLAKDTTDADLDTRVAARDALAAIGDAKAAEALLAGADSAKDFERTQAAEAALLLAKRLTDAGRKKDAEAIYRKLWTSRTAPEERQVRIAALIGLAATKGDIADIFAAMQVDDPQVRAAAIDLARALPGEDTTMQCVAAMKRAAGVERANLLTLLGGRGDLAALAAVLPMFEDADELVRIAAMRAAAALGGKDAAEALITTVNKKTGNDRAAAADALSRMRGAEAGIAMAAALTAAPTTEIKIALLGAMAARKIGDQSKAVAEAAADKEPAVRLAALKALGALAGGGELSAVATILKATTDAAELAAAEAAMKAASARHQEGPVGDQTAAALKDAAAPANTMAMLRVLGVTGARKALEAVVTCTTNPNAEVRDAAVRALAEWRNKDAAGPLLGVAKTSDNPVHKTLALREAVRHVSKDTSPEEKMKVLPEALKLATRPEEKREAIAALAGVKTAEALLVVAAALDDDTIKEEAAMAVVQIAGEVAKKNPDAVREPLGKVLRATKNERTKADAEKILGPAAK